jgi:hypothetical protein
MGWRLAEEVAWARPERPGVEWWTLLDLAQDARDQTRQGMPGHEYLAARAKRSGRTVERRLKTLADAGLVKVVTRSAPGRRAVYEIAELNASALCVTSETHDNIAVGCSDANARQNGAERPTESGQRPTLTPDPATSRNAAASQVTEAGSMSTPPSDPPSYLSVNRAAEGGKPAEVEGASPARDDGTETDHRSDRYARDYDLRTRAGTEEARRAQHDRLNAWLREHPEAAS